MVTTTSKKYFTGVYWFVLSLVCSAFNDIIAKYLGLRLHSFEVSFFRFSFSVLILIPFILFCGKESIKSRYFYIHIARGTLLFCGMTSWVFGLTIAPVTTATILSFTIPLFILVLAVFFLNENITWQRWIITIIGFVGIVIVLKPNARDFNYQTLIFILAAIAFAGLDIINKKFIVKESMLSMLFYSAIVTAILSLPPSLMYWQTPTMYELFLLSTLGITANLILFFLLKAFALVDATAIAPYRYLELVITAVAAYVVFGEIPQKHIYHGILIIIPTTLFIIFSEKKSFKK